MKEKLTFIEFLFKDFLENAKIHAENKEVHEKEWKKYREGKVPCYPYNRNDMNKNHGKTVLKRKITYLRQELLNLEKMMDGDADGTA